MRSSRLPAPARGRQAETAALESLSLLSEARGQPCLTATLEWRRHPAARRASLRIDPRSGRLIVTLPPRGSRRAGHALIALHRDWIAASLRALPEATSLADGAAVPLHGVPHALRHHPQARRGVWAEDGEIHVSGEAAFLPRRVTDFLLQEARDRFGPLAQQAAGSVDLRPRRVLIKEMRSRWGSCAPDGTLAFSWRLAMAPPAVQAYVAAHEVAHLRHLDHGAAFWSLVAQLDPDWEDAEAWLAAHGPRLMRIG